LALLAASGSSQDRVARDGLLPTLLDVGIYLFDQLLIRHAGLVRDTVWAKFVECPLCSGTEWLLARCSFAQLRQPGRCVSGRADRCIELFSIETEARPNLWAVFTPGCRAILAPITYSFAIGFGLAS